MTMPQPSVSSVSLRFPTFPEEIDLSHFSMIIQDLSLTYEVTAVATLPIYGYVQMPANQLGPRRWSMLYAEDRVQVGAITLASPLILVLTALGVGAPHILKAWIDVLNAGQNLRERAQALRENRALASERLRTARLNNELTEQEIRRARAQADIDERARDEILGAGQNEEPRQAAIDSPRRANSLTADDFALLLDDPIRRIRDYGGELEISTEGEDSPTTQQGP
jgi:hypothetical protein